MSEVGPISERIRSFIIGKFPLARKNSLKDGDKLLETGILDSLGILDLVSFLEAEFSIQMSDEDLLPENFESIESVTKFIKSKMRATSDRES